MHRGSLVTTVTVCDECSLLGYNVTHFIIATVRSPNRTCLSMVWTTGVPVFAHISNSHF